MSSRTSYRDIYAGFITEIDLAITGIHYTYVYFILQLREQNT